MLAGPQLVAGPAAPGGERARLLSLYVQDYLECVESLPLDIQRNVSLLREVDTRCQGGLRHSASAAGQREGGREGRTGGEGGAGGRPPAAHAPGAESGAPGCGPSPGPVGGRRRRRGAALAVRRGGAPPLSDRGAGAAEPPRPALGPGLPSRLKIRPGVEGEAMRRRGCSSRARGAELRHSPPLAARLGTLRWSNRSNRQRSAVARPLLPADVSAARGVRGRYEPRSSARSGSRGRRARRGHAGPSGGSRPRLRAETALLPKRPFCRGCAPSASCCRAAQPWGLSF